MPSRRGHLKFDDYLIEKGYLNKEYDYNPVHNRLPSLLFRF